MNKNLLPLFIIILFISACSKKSNVPPNNNNSSLLIGSWFVVSEHDRFYTTTTNTLVEDSTYNISAKKYAWTNIFNKNGTYYDVDYYDMPLLDTILSAHYSVSNQIINYTYDNNGVIGQYTILKISDTNLTLEQTFEISPTPGETQRLPPGTYKCVADTYYTKQ
ncbi:hypothetical protein [Mucilaginibacter sp.]